jgi:hypothetical protein
MALPPLLLVSAITEESVENPRQRREIESGDRERERKDGRGKMEERKAEERKTGGEERQRQGEAETNGLFFWRRDAFLTQELLKRGEPRFIVRRNGGRWRLRAVYTFRFRNCGNEMITEFIPVEKSLFTQSHGHGKHFSLPRVVENQFSTPTR